MTAECREIPGAPGYMAGRDGTIWGLRGLPLKPYPGVHGYPIVTVHTSTGRHTRAVHALVALAWLGPRPDGAQVNHIDGIKTNASVENLEYVTGRQNHDHAIAHGLSLWGERNPEHKLTNAQVEELLEGHRNGERTTRLAVRFGVSYSYALRIVKGHARARRSA